MSVAIATEFLRVATQYGLWDYYPSASDNYRWGMSGYNPTVMEINRQPLVEEIERIKPLLDQSVYRHWSMLLEANSPMLLEEIMQFWDRQNIRPSTPFNERLIEHWERISYAREHYIKRSDPPYNTDARGVYYVKYGEAGYIETGRVDVTQDKISWILDQFSPPGDENYTPTNYELMLVTNSISNLFLNPEYELWIYDSPDEGMDHNLVLIFGHSSGGRFGRLEVLEDFMPVSAFNSLPVLQRSIDNPALPIVPPGLFLQMIYYEHFYAKDQYFAQLYDNLNSEVFRDGMGRYPDANLTGILRNRNINQTTRLISQAPLEFSTEEKMIPEIPIEVYQYRLLDEFNRPVLATFVESYPHHAFISDFIQNEETLTSEPVDIGGYDDLFEWYQLIHGLQLRSGQWDMLGQARQFPELIVDPYADIPTRSVMLIPWSDQTDVLVFYAELMNIHPGSEPQTESLFSESLRGLGKVEVAQPERLTVNDGELVVGDVILGYQKMDESSDDQILFHFTPANNRKIPEGENLVVHFEVYQLQTDADGFSSFELDYRIQPRTRLLDWLRSQADQFTISLTFENEGDRFAESLEIETIQLEPGSYELTLTFRDNANNQSHEQQLQFEVVESADN